jgi:hypothetical protein
VFLDESGTAIDLARRDGRPPRGRRVRGAVPHGRWEHLTIPGGPTLAGLTVCLAVEGAADAPLMRAFVRHALVPAPRPGQVVVLDNLGVHRDAEVRRLVEVGCTRLFLLLARPQPT